MSKNCPINWTAADGPYPCAFRTAGYCSYAEQCVPLHNARYVHAITPVTVKCSRCGVDTSVATGVFERHNLRCVETICGTCSMEDIVLARHVAGEL
jgi:hypothetical protein